MLFVKFPALWKFVVWKYVGIVVYNINKGHFTSCKLCNKLVNIIVSCKT